MRVYKSQECTVCACARDIKGTSRWSGTGIFAYLDGCTRDPPTSYDTPSEYTHFLPGGHGRFRGVPRPPTDWRGLNQYILDNGEAEPEGGFGTATVPNLEPLTRAIARAFVTKAQKNKLTPYQPANYMPAHYLQREALAHKVDASELALEAQTIRNLVVDQLSDKKASKGLDDVLIMYVDKAIDEACEKTDEGGNFHYSPLYKLKQDVAEKAKKDKSCVVS